MNTDKITAIAKALSDPNRLKALMLLVNGEFCVCQIVDFLKLSPSTVSKHMSILKAAGLVKSRKDERWIYYRLPGNESAPEQKGILSWLATHLQSGDKRGFCCGMPVPKKIMEKSCQKKTK